MVLVVPKSMPRRWPNAMRVSVEPRRTDAISRAGRRRGSAAYRSAAVRPATDRTAGIRHGRDAHRSAACRVRRCGSRRWTRRRVSGRGTAVRQATGRSVGPSRTGGRGGPGSRPGGRRSSRRPGSRRECGYPPTGWRWGTVGSPSARRRPTRPPRSPAGSGRQARRPGCRRPVPLPRELVPYGLDVGWLAAQHSGDGGQESVPIGDLDAAHPGQIPLAAGEPVIGVPQRQDPIQRRYRQPGLGPAEVGPEGVHRRSGSAGHVNERPVHDRKPGHAGYPLHPDTYRHLRTAAGPVPARLRPLQQIAFQPRRLMHRVACDRLDAHDLRHHPDQMTPITQIRPVRADPLPENRRTADVQHPSTGVPEPVHAGTGRQPPDDRPRAPTSFPAS